jgi:DNA relaxase NicK
MVGEDYHLVRPSRLDIAFTFRLQEYRQELAKYYYTMGNSSHGAACRPRQRRFFSNREGGETLYIGSTSSDSMLRLYDKQEEQKGQGLYERCWRLELQARRETARVLWHAVNDCPDRERAIRGVLKAQCEREGILGFINWNGSAVKLAAPDRPAQYLERRLEWLERQVRPTVRELTQEGYGAAVLRSLGLDPDRYSW